MTVEQHINSVKIQIKKVKNQIADLDNQVSSINRSIQKKEEEYNNACKNIDRTIGDMFSVISRMKNNHSSIDDIRCMSYLTDYVGNELNNEVRRQEQVHNQYKSKMKKIILDMYDQVDNIYDSKHKLELKLESLRRQLKQLEQQRVSHM